MQDFDRVDNTSRAIRATSTIPTQNTRRNMKNTQQFYFVLNLITLVFGAHHVPKSQV